MYSKASPFCKNDCGLAVFCGCGTVSGVLDPRLPRKKKVDHKTCEKLVRRFSKPPLRLYFVTCLNTVKIYFVRGLAYVKLDLG